MSEAWLQNQVCDQTKQWGLWNWPDGVSGLAELLLLHQVGLIDYNEIRQSNLPARTLNVSQWISFLFFSRARGWQQPTLAQMGAERCLAWRWKHKQSAGMQRGRTTGLFFIACVCRTATNTQLREDANRGARGDGVAGGKEHRQQPQGHVCHSEHAGTFSSTLVFGTNGL